MNIVILSTADFDAPIWTNKQQLAVRLAEHAQVVYINSLGLRKPQINSKDFLRIVKKIKSMVFSPVKSSVSNLRVIQPWLIPFHSNIVVRRLNGSILKTQIRRVLRKANLEKSILWSFSPLTYGIEDLFDALVYHSVDLLHTIPGVNRESLLSDEKALLAKADRVIASSEGVKSHLMKLGTSEVTLWENVADVKLFSSFAKSERLKQAVYFGNLTDSKVDPLILEALARSGIQLLIAGPKGIDGTQGSWVGRLNGYPNTTVLESVSQREMAEICGLSKVGIIPYKCDEHTAGVFPLKLYEYLSSGLLVVSTPLESLRDRYIPNLRIVSSADFVDAVWDMLEISNSASKLDSSRYFENSWEYRVDQMLSLCRSLETDSP